jgi:hypothetical protein
MNHSINATVAVRRYEANFIIKATFGFAIAFIVIIGAGLALAGRDFPFWQGVLAGLAGGVFGFVAARKIHFTVAHPEG